MDTTTLAIPATHTTPATTTATITITAVIPSSLVKNNTAVTSPLEDDDDDPICEMDLEVASYEEEAKKQETLSLPSSVPHFDPAPPPAAAPAPTASAAAAAAAAAAGPTASVSATVHTGRFVSPSATSPPKQKQKKTNDTGTKVRALQCQEDMKRLGVLNDDADVEDDFTLPLTPLLFNGRVMSSSSSSSTDKVTAVSSMKSGAAAFDVAGATAASEAPAAPIPTANAPVDGVAYGNGNERSSAAIVAAAAPLETNNSAALAAASFQQTFAAAPPPVSYEDDTTKKRKASPSGSDFGIG